MTSAEEAVVADAGRQRRSGQSATSAVAKVSTARAAKAVFLRDWRGEWRTRAAFNAALLFAVSAPIALSFNVATQKLAPEALGGCFWAVLLFAALVGLARAFVKEEESGTVSLLRLNAPGEAVLWGKMAFNFALLVITQLCAVPIFIVLLDARIAAPAVLLGVLVLGDIGLSAISTLLGAMAAQTRSRGALFSAIAVPVLLPLLISASAATGVAFGARIDPMPALQVMAAYDAAMLAAAWMLFDFVWSS